MKSPNLYEESGNLIMRGTPEYTRALKEHSKNKNKNNAKTMEKELKSLRKSELIKKFHEMMDPDHTEDVSSETKDEIIERIVTYIKNLSGGKRRRNKTRKLT